MIKNAIVSTIVNHNIKTSDIGGTATTAEFMKKVMEEIEAHTPEIGNYYLSQFLSFLIFEIIIKNVTKRIYFTFDFMRLNAHTHKGKKIFEKTNLLQSYLSIFLSLFLVFLNLLVFICFTYRKFLKIIIISSSPSKIGHASGK